MPSFTFFEPILISTLLNVAMTLGLYVTALSGQLSLATAAIAGVGGYTAGVLTSRYGVPFAPAVVAAAVMGAALGTVLAALTARMRDFILKLTTLAAGEALSVLAFNWDYIGGANSLTGLPPYTGLWTCIVVAAIALYVAWRFDGSRLGYASRAVRDDPLAAASMGVSVLKVRVITFALGSALIGMAGAAQAHYLAGGHAIPAWLLRFAKLHHFLAVRRHPDLGRPHTGCRRADRLAGSAAVRQRVSPHHLRPDHCPRHALATRRPVDPATTWPPPQPVRSDAAACPGAGRPAERGGRSLIRRYPGAGAARPSDLPGPSLI